MFIHVEGIGRMRNFALDIHPVPEGDPPPGTQFVARAIIAGISPDSIVVVQRPADDHTDPLKWCLPGGRGKPGETPLTILERELREEMGVTLKMAQKFSAVEYILPKGPPWHVYHFSAVIGSYDYTIDATEIAAVAEITLDNYQQYEYLQGEVEIIAAYLTGMKN